MSEKSGSEGVIAKIFVGVATAVLTTVILYKLGLKDKPENPPTPPVSNTNIKPADPPKNVEKPKPPTSFAAEPAMPTNTCPTVEGMFYMQYPHIWYGPFAGGDGITYSSMGGFAVYSAQMLNTFGTYGSVLTYPDPYRQYPRNVWIPLQQSRFSICIDSSGNVFGWAQQ